MEEKDAKRSEDIFAIGVCAGFKTKHTTLSETKVTELYFSLSLRSSHRHLFNLYYVSLTW